MLKDFDRAFDMATRFGGVDGAVILLYNMAQQERDTNSMYVAALTKIDEMVGDAAVHELILKVINDENDHDATFAKCISLLTAGMLKRGTPENLDQEN